MNLIYKVLFVLVICVLGLILVVTPHGPSSTELISSLNEHRDKVVIRTGHNRENDPKKFVKIENTETKLKFPHQEDDSGSGEELKNSAKNNKAVVESHSYEDIILPLVYPVHRTLPKRQNLIYGLEAERAKQCNATKLFLESPLLLLDQFPKKKTKIQNAAEEKSTQVPRKIIHSLYSEDELKRIKKLLEKQFETSLQFPLFADEHEYDRDDEEDKEQDHFWWIPFAYKEDYIVRKRTQKEQQEYPDSDYFDDILEKLNKKNHHNDDDDHHGDGNHDDSRIPCTAEVQYLLKQWQNPPNPGHPIKNNVNHDNEHHVLHQDDECDPHVKGLVSPLKSGAHGVGSAITLLAHDFLSAILIGRRFVLAGSNVNKKNNNNGGKSTWYFAPEGCEDRGSGGWECLFLPPTKCFRKLKKAEKVHVVRSIATSNNNAEPYFDADANPASWNRHRLITKSSFDIPGLSRNEFPTVEKFFETLLSAEPNAKRRDVLRKKCVPLVKKWVAGGGVSSNPDDEHNMWSAKNRILMGTFKNAANPVLIYELAQVTSYLLRGLQPWFKQVIRAHLKKTMFGGKTSESSSTKTPFLPKSVIFIHDRGEIAKYREYYNSFGCHKFSQGAYQRELTDFLCPVTNKRGKDALLQLQERQQQLSPSSSSLLKDYCTVFVSGNMPFAEYQSFSKKISEANDHLIRTLRPPRIRSHDLIRKNDKNAFAARDLPPIFVVQSTWNLTSSKKSNADDDDDANKQSALGAVTAETARWGASHPAASWVDLFAGMHSTAWACVVQSNWCRVVDFLRLTLMRRADCPFVDMGIASLSDGELRLRYCMVKDEWPKKPFSSVVGKNWKLV